MSFTFNINVKFEFTGMGKTIMSIAVILMGPSQTDKNLLKIKKIYVTE